jgi:uncharacterized protein YjbJ (UPF0337 family)
MNSDEFEGGVRYVGGKVGKAAGDALGKREWQADGVVDQVAGGAQNLYGRAKSVIGDAVDHAPELTAQARERLKAAGEQVADVATRNGKQAVDTVRDEPLLWALAAALGGYGLAWWVHGRRG